MYTYILCILCIRLVPRGVRAEEPREGRSREPARLPKAPGGVRQGQDYPLRVDVRDDRGGLALHKQEITTNYSQTFNMQTTDIIQATNYTTADYKTIKQRQ